VKQWIVLLIVLIPPFVRAEEPLAKAIEAVIDGPDYTQAHWGILVSDAKTGEAIYQRNAEKLFTPASTTKLFSCAAAMVAYGADHRFTTPVYARSKINPDGVVKGDLVLVASGDLAFGGRFTRHGKLEFADQDHTYANSGNTETKLTECDPLTALKDLAAQLEAAGLREVTGDVLIDDRLFASARGTGSGPDAVSPILVNDNVVDIVITPGAKPGDRAKVALVPETAGVQADIDVSTGNESQPPSITLAAQGVHSFSIRGRVPAGKPPIVRIYPLSEPAAFARTCFIECLRRKGIRVNAPLLKPTHANLPEKDDYEHWHLLAKHTSASFGEMLKVTLKVSHNLYASTLPCLVAAKKGKRTLEEGLREQGRILKDLGVHVETISFAGGAGGAAADKITPKATVQLLQALAKRSDWEQYKGWLPGLGIDGTLSTVVPPTSPARGKVFAKTGTLSWNDGMNGRTLLTSKALAGTMTTATGRELHFAMFVNDAPLPKEVGPSREGKVLGKLCEIVYDGVK
jgi:D-alanyl-D-alanine carboxypeptidase/D-alanyl-D-alanine-endopeptidase (penicillin-binding protein 4)